MPSLDHRQENFIDRAFEWTRRIFDAAPSGLTTLRVPIVPAMLDGFAFARFPNLDHLTVAAYGAAHAISSLDGSVVRSTRGKYPGVGTVDIPVIETILPQLPRLRSLVVRGNSRHPLRKDIVLESSSLESFIVHNDKELCVASYRCPKLRTLQLSCWFTAQSAWTALETGTHAIDLRTVPPQCKSKLFDHGFADGVFSFGMVGCSWVSDWLQDHDGEMV